MDFKRGTKIFIVLILLISFSSAQDKSILNIEEEILNEINFARTKPNEYIEILKGLKKYYYGRELRLPGKTRLITYEGVRSLNETIIFMEKQKPLFPMRSSKGLEKAAILLMEEQSKSGATGHIAKNGEDFSIRMEQFGKWSGSIAENIGYGTATAREIVYQLIIDDGVQSRGHRENIFNPHFKYVGIAFGTHPKWRTVCVMDFAQGFEEFIK